MAPTESRVMDFEENITIDNSLQVILDAQRESPADPQQVEECP